MKCRIVNVLHAQLVSVLCVAVNIILTLLFFKKLLSWLRFTCSTCSEWTVLSYFDPFFASETQSQASHTSTFMVLTWIQLAHSNGIRLQVSQGGQWWMELHGIHESGHQLPVIDNRRLATFETGVFHSISTCPHTVSSKK